MYITIYKNGRIQMSKMNLKEYLEKRNDYFDENIKMTNEGKKYGD